MTTTTTSVGVAFLTGQQKQEWWGGINRASRPCPREIDNPRNLLLTGLSFSFRRNNQHMSHHRVVSATPSGLTSHESDNPHDLLLPGYDQHVSHHLVLSATTASLTALSLR
jgi:hypothetical protein